MLADLIRRFSAERHLQVIENYRTHTLLGEEAITLGIVVPPSRNFFEVLEDLAIFLKAKLDA